MAKVHVLCSVVVFGLLGIAGCSNTLLKNVDNKTHVKVLEKQNEADVTPEVDVANEDKSIKTVDLEVLKNKLAIEAIKEEKSEPLEKEIKGPTWIKLEPLSNEGIVPMLARHHINNQWIELLPEDQRKAFVNNSSGIDIHIIYDNEGIVEDVYGKGNNDRFFRITRRQEGYTSLKIEGFAAETKIGLSVSHRTKARNLGRAQNLALKHILSEVSKKKSNTEYDRFFHKGDLEISFKALFINGSLVGPTEIVEAKARLEGQELTL